jgi:hypothetical protein
MFIRKYIQLPKEHYHQILDWFKCFSTIQSRTKYARSNKLIFIRKEQIIIIITIYLNCKCFFFTRWQWYYEYNKTQHTNNTQHSNRNTAHRTTQTIKDTLYTMNTMQIQLQLQQIQSHQTDILSPLCHRRAIERRVSYMACG